MCILIAKPADAIVDIDTLKNCWDSNGHGAGVAYAAGGEVTIEKGFMTWDTFKKFIIDPDDWADIPMLIHFRIKTRGDMGEDNTHPFEVIPGKLAFAHNGTLDLKVEERPELSDTNVFCRYVLKQLPHNFLSNSGITTLIDQSLKGRSKLAFLDSEGEITIFNEELGHEDEAGVWYSNSGYLPSRPAPYTRSGYLPLAAEPTVRTVDEVMMDDWYCHDCCIWFDEFESPPFTFTSYDVGDGPMCPHCGTNDRVSYDPLDIDEESSTKNLFEHASDYLDDAVVAPF